MIPENRGRLARLRTLIHGKLDELRQTIELRDRAGPEAALPVVESNRGIRIMDQIRSLSLAMEASGRRLLEERTARLAKTARLTEVTLAAGAVLLLGLIFLFTGMTRRHLETRARFEAEIIDPERSEAAIASGIL